VPLVPLHAPVAPRLLAPRSATQLQATCGALHRHVSGMTEVTTDTTDATNRKDRPVAVGDITNYAAAWSVVSNTCSQKSWSVSVNTLTAHLCGSIITDTIDRYRAINTVGAVVCQLLLSAYGNDSCSL